MTMEITIFNRDISSFMVVFPASHDSFHGFNDATNFKLELLRNLWEHLRYSLSPIGICKWPVVGGKPTQPCLKWLSVKAIMRCILGDFFLSGFNCFVNFYPAKLGEDSQWHFFCLRDVETITEEHSEDQVLAFSWYNPWARGCLRFESRLHFLVRTSFSTTCLFFFQDDNFLDLYPFSHNHRSGKSP